MPFKGVLLALALSLLPATPGWTQQVVRAGVSDTGAPFAFHDPATNTDRGLMVELINEIATTAGFSLQPQSMPFPSLLSSLTMGKIDLIVGTLAVTPQRAGQMAFSQKVYTDSDALVVPKSDAKQYVTYDDLKGKVLGLQKGVVPLQSLHTDLYPKIRVYDGGPDVMRALAAGEVDVAIANRSITGYLLKTNAFPMLQLVASFKPTTFGDVAFGARKDDSALIGKVNGALAKIQATGKLDSILANWGVQ